ncbi:TetR/AcrR family transcriptional regulator [Brevundimonas aurantiaca]|uniref:TetR/AcrR family transcriptional regulator n=1 Tax=Brevundimonas aurantiaca TaxID=74316 RepID=UPI00191B8E02|nr:helix-turn-helix domain-containing protein [Brevundimonas aurantiaca]
MSPLAALNAALANPPESRARRRHSPDCRRQQNKTVTRARVLAAATKLFAQVGYEQATLRAIAAAAGLSTGSVFGNWPDKAALYREAHGHDPLTPEQGRAAVVALAWIIQGLIVDGDVAAARLNHGLTLLNRLDPDWRTRAPVAAPGLNQEGADQ